MNPDSTLNINAVEAFPVEEFSAEVKKTKTKTQTSFRREIDQTLRALSKEDIEIFTG